MGVLPNFHECFYNSIETRMTENMFSISFRKHRDDKRGNSLLTLIISNGNRTEWSPIRSVIIRVITKSDDRARFVYHEYDYRLNWTTRSPIIN